MFTRVLYVFCLWCRVSLEFWSFRYDILAYLVCPRSYLEPPLPFYPIFPFQAWFWLLVSWHWRATAVTLCACAHNCYRRQSAQKPQCRGTAIIGSSPKTLHPPPFLPFLLFLSPWLLLPLPPFPLLSSFWPLHLLVLLPDLNLLLLASSSSPFHKVCSLSSLFLFLFGMIILCLHCWSPCLVV